MGTMIRTSQSYFVRMQKNTLPQGLAWSLLGRGWSWVIGVAPQPQQETEAFSVSILKQLATDQKEPQAEPLGSPAYSQTEG